MSYRSRPSQCNLRGRERWSNHDDYKPLSQPGNQTDELWRAWATITLSQLGKSAAEALARFPVGSAPQRVGTARALLWVLETLSSRETLRVNCGSSEDERDASGALWVRDCLALGQGEALRSGPVGAPLPDDSERQFVFGIGGYAIPVPQGVYDVTVNPVAARDTLGSRRRFDIEVEGRVLVRDVSTETARRRGDSRGSGEDQGYGWDPGYSSDTQGTLSCNRGNCDNQG